MCQNDIFYTTSAVDALMCMHVLFFWIIAWDYLIPFNKNVGDVGNRKSIVIPRCEVGDVFIKKRKEKRSRWRFYS